MPLSVLRRVVATVVAVGAVPAGIVAWPGKAHAAAPVATDHYVATQTDYFPKAGDDPSTFYGIFSLDGVCGFPHATYSQSDTETFFVAQHNNGQTSYKYNAVGRIDDEPWSITPVAGDGTAGAAYVGTADEVATSTGYADGAMPTSVNYTFTGTATNPAGVRLRLVVKGVMRTGADGSITRFDWGVQSCQLVAARG
jgi:hypothetical protein